MLSAQYAKALFELADKNLDEIKNQFDALIELRTENPLFLKFLNSPAIKKSDKQKLIDEAFKGFNQIFVQFLAVINKQQRFNLLDDIYEDFNRLIIDKNDIVVINAYTASVLDDEAINKLIEELKPRFKGEIRINNIVNHKYIGGIRLEYNGQSIDQTLKTQMQNMKALL